MSIMANGHYDDTELQIFSHYPGQLMMTLDSPSFESKFSEYRWQNTLEIKLSQGTLVKNRPHSKNKCIHRIEYHDAYVQKHIIKEAKCVPPYWNESFANELGIDKCDTATELRKVHEFTENQKKMRSSPDPPCFTWFGSFTYTWQLGLNSDVSYIHIVYQDKYYAELVYSKAFGIEQLWSGIGGFAGLFIGFSLMQSPELIGKLRFG